MGTLRATFGGESLGGNAQAHSPVLGIFSIFFIAYCLVFF
jgi:hypothetical protein